MLVLLSPDALLRSLKEVVSLLRAASATVWDAFETDGEVDAGEAMDADAAVDVDDGIDCDN